MQTRKLQQVGGGTYTVSIPKEWADDHALEAGMELHLYTHHDGSIVVRTAEKDGDELADATVEVAGSDPALVERAIESAHAAGFETLTLVPDEGFTAAQRTAARETVRGLVGTELLVERDDEITVQHLLDAGTVSVRQSVVQLQFTARSVHREAVDALVAGDGDAAERLAERGAEAARVARMVTRHFARSLVSLEEVDRLGVSRPVLFDYYVTARALGRVAEQGVELARVAERVPDRLPEELGADIREAAAAARRVVDDATTAVVEGVRTDAAHAILDDRADAVAAIDALHGALLDGGPAGFDGETATALGVSRALDGLVRTADCGATIAEVALRAATRDENAAVRADGAAPDPG